ncbi:hypothetical protein AALB_0573 [Agarivorans albus MKT 106]|uniref:Uncharacterized protein n=1 Tax=Agarivorans albus MKT 106 TaxID=1331007 RepID=R9PGX1_AGAAL|nr:hypothetical protein AALB_0573 [Agarivorans albus MKT 106]
MNAMAVNSAFGSKKIIPPSNTEMAVSLSKKKPLLSVSSATNPV